MQSNHFLVACLTLLAGWSGVTQPVQAVELRDGKTYFQQPPRLVQAATTNTDIRSWGATYYFTLQLPKNAGAALQKVVIVQKDQVDNALDYDPRKTVIFEGNCQQRGTQLKPTEVTFDRNTQTLTVTLDPPVAPGKTITIGLKPSQNPRFSGVYLFGITAFPTGNNPQGQFLGFGRLTFYDSGNGNF